MRAESGLHAPAGIGKTRLLLVAELCWPVESVLNRHSVHAAAMMLVDLYAMPRLSSVGPRHRTSVKDRARVLRGQRPRQKKRLHLYNIQSHTPPAFVAASPIRTPTALAIGCTAYIPVTSLPQPSRSKRQPCAGMLRIDG